MDLSHSTLQKSIVESKQFLWNGAVYLRGALAKVPAQLRARLPAMGPIRKIASTLTALQTPMLTPELFKQKMAAPGSLELRDSLARFITEFQTKFNDSKTTEHQYQKGTMWSSTLGPDKSAPSVAPPAALSASLPIRPVEPNPPRSFSFAPFHSSAAERDELISKAQTDRGQFFCEFIDKMVELMRNNPIWSAYVVGDEGSVRTQIQAQLVPKIFDRLCLANRDRDAQFATYLTGLSFITQKHLDIGIPLDEGLIASCGASLAELNFEKTPYGKLGAIHKCCSAIFEYLKTPKAAVGNASGGQSKASATQGSLGQGNQSHEVTVDEFLPVLIFVVIRTNPFGILSNLAYITACSSGEWGMEENYFLTSLEIAVRFLEQLQPHQLTEPPSNDVVSDWILLDESTPK